MSTWSWNSAAGGNSFGDTTIIRSLADFPTPVAGVITLPADTTWMVASNVDIGSNRIVCSGITTIAGLGQETCSLSATLAATEALITATSSVTLRSITITTNAGAVGTRVDGGGTAALDWLAVNFRGGRAAELTNVANSVNVLIGVFDDGVYVFGTIQTLAFTDSIFTPGTGQIGVCVDPGATISRRIRFVDTAVVALGTGVGLDVPSATVPSEGFIMSLVNFSGPGTYVTGTVYTDDDARWIECRGVTNTTRVGEITWEANATATVIAVPGTYVKAAGTSTLEAATQRFSMPADNRLQYDAALTETFRIVVTCSASSTNNKLIAVHARLNGVTPLTPPARSTTNSGGRAEGVTYQGITTLSTGDYIEVWIANETSTDNVIVEDLVVQIMEV